MVFGHAVAIFFGFVMGGFHQIDMSYYNMGTNFMLVAIALGGFYLILLCVLFYGYLFRYQLLI
jgi:hypothetical protein